MSIGPTSLMAILASSYTRDLPVEFMVLLALLAGCVELCMGLLNLGFLVDFISAPVVSGFTSATSVIIVATQVRGLLGLSGPRGHGFVGSVMAAWRQLASGDWSTGDACIGAGSVCALLLLRRLSRDMKCVRSPRLRRALWFVSISRNALVVVACSALACWYESNGGAPFRLSGAVPSGLPKISFPSTHVSIANGTEYTFTDMCAQLGTGLVFVPIVAVLANVAIAKSFGEY